MFYGDLGTGVVWELKDLVVVRALMKSCSLGTYERMLFGDLGMSIVWGFQNGRCLGTNVRVLSGGLVLHGD